jgi:curved DNA-binding protein
MSNYYDLLGVNKDASDKEIRQAYRRLARQYHPDVNKTDEGAEDKFKQVNEAYTVLSDEESRKKYDRHGDKWRYADQINSAETAPGAGRRWTYVDGDNIFSSFGGGGMFEDLLGMSSTRNRAWRPPPTEYRAEISLEDAFRGATRTLRTQDGRTLEVRVPAGVDNGSRVHIAPGGPGGQDFYLVVSVAEHPRFRRDGHDLYVDVDLQIEDAVLGTEIRAPTLTGQVALTVPPNTPNERRFRLAGQGMPPLSNSGARGDLYVTVKLRLPTDMSDEEVELFRQLRALREDSSATADAPSS